MKLLLVYISLLIASASFGQINAYHPYPDGWAASWQWEKVVNYGSGPEYVYPKYNMHGDTIINGINYKKVYVGDWTSELYIGAFRQNVVTEEAYYLNSQNGIEYDLSFDYTANVGDTIITHLFNGMTPFFPGGGDTAYIVNYVGAKNIGNEVRGEFGLEPLSGIGSGAASYRVVTGVGATSYGGFEFGGQLWCLVVNHNPWIGGVPGEAPCFLSVPEVPETALFISPNPVVNQVTLSQVVDEISLCSMDGQMVYSNVLTDRIDMIALPSGMYIAEMLIGDQKITRKVIKK